MIVKKFLVFGLAVLATTALTTSCSHDDLYDATQDINVAKYEAMFIQKFGKPAPNQTWGFGEVKKTRSTRAIPSPFDFPIDADASKFLADVPTGTEIITGRAASVNGYIDETYEGEFEAWGNYIDGKTTGGTLYVKGDCDFSDRRFYFAGNSEMYLVEGATLTLRSSDAANLQGGTSIYIAEGAKIVTDGKFVLNKGMYVYNHGTIEAASLSLNENEWGKEEFNTLYNGTTGLIKVTGNLAGTKDKACIVNDGEIQCAEFNTAGSSHIQNNGTMTVSGTTTINSNDNTWINNGQYTTKNFIYTAGSNNVINNCRLTVTELFKINLGDSDTNGFRMDSNCGVVTKNFELAGPARIYMGSNSVFKVNNEAKMNITKKDYGIYGPEDGEYAVFQARDITCNNPKQRFNVSYLNKLYVVSETHFDFGYDNIADESLWDTHTYSDGDGPFYYTAGGAVVYTGGNKPSINIPETACNPGFGGGGDGFTPVIRVMAEDLTVTDASKDFDFNDIVFDVMWIDGGAKLRLNAAGGTLPLTVGGTTGPDGIEVHQAFKEANPTRNISTTTMMNTTKNRHYSYVCPIITLYGDFKNSDGENNANLIKIFVNKGTDGEDNWIEITAETGKVAAKFGCDPSTEWADERQDIEEKFPSFGAWVRGEASFFQ